MSNERGQSIIQVLVATGLAGIVMAALTTMTVNQQHEVASLNQKLSALELQKLIMDSMVDGAVCQYVLNNPARTFNADTVVGGGTATLTPGVPLPVSYKAGPPAEVGPALVTIDTPATPGNGIVYIKTIDLKVTGAPAAFTPGPDTTFSGHWEIGFDPTKLQRPMAPVRVPVIIKADTSTPGSSRVTSCKPTTPPPPPPPVVPAQSVAATALWYGRQWNETSGDLSAGDLQIVTGQCPPGYFATGCGPLCFSYWGMRYCYGGPSGPYCTAMCQNNDGSPCAQIAVDMTCLKVN